MASKERIPVSFWLKDKTVTGLLVADHGGKKLVSYSGRYFVVSDKTPEKRHYTESTLPASWRKIVAGNVPSPAAPKTRKAAGKPAPVPVEDNTALATPREVGVPAKKEGQQAAPESSKAAKPSRKGAKAKQPLAKGQTAESQEVRYSCPYCSTAHSCSADKAGAPFFQQCSKCGKDFGVKITARMVYQAEVAAFK